MVRSLNEGAISGLNESFTNLAAVSVHLYGSDHFGRIWLHLLACAYASVSPHVFLRAGLRAEIGRASCRERVCQYVWISVVAVSLKKQHYRTNKTSDDSTKRSHHTTQNK